MAWTPGANPGFFGAGGGGPAWRPPPPLGDEAVLRIDRGAYNLL